MKTAHQMIGQAKDQTRNASVPVAGCQDGKYCITIPQHTERLAAQQTNEVGFVVTSAMVHQHPPQLRKTVFISNAARVFYNPRFFVEYLHSFVHIHKRTAVDAGHVLVVHRRNIDSPAWCSTSLGHLHWRRRRIPLGWKLWKPTSPLVPRGLPQRVGAHPRG